MVEIVERIPRENGTSLSVITPMDMLNNAVMAGADISILEKLMGLQERWEANQARKSFDAAIAEAKAQIKPVAKTAKGHSGNYADFASIARTVDPVLSECGLSYRFRTAQTEKSISVTCVLSHRDGHSEETTLTGPADTSGSKNAIQAIGSTLSYLQRYSLVQMLGLASAKDDDGHAAGLKAGTDNADVSGDLLNDEQIGAIRNALAFAGRDEARFLKHIGVASLSDIFADKYKACLAIIQGK